MDYYEIFQNNSVIEHLEMSASVFPHSSVPYKRARIEGLNKLEPEGWQWLLKIQQNEISW